MTRIAAALRNIMKVYPGTIAARGVTVEFFPGEIHALIGENGAGKSTLVKILTGLIQPDSGVIEVNGRAVRLNSVRAALAEGIGVIHQTGSLIRTMTVEENLRLTGLFTAKTRPNGPDSRGNFTLARDINPDRLVCDLSPRERQLVEIDRLLMQKARLLVLDEPTASLSPQESNSVFRELGDLAKAGYAVVVVSHKLTELINVKYCKRFTVLRKGKVVWNAHRSVVTVERLVKYMSGADAVPLASSAPVKAPPPPPPPPVRRKRLRKGRQVAAPTDEGLLVVFRKVRTTLEAGEELRGIDLTLRRGEILGLAGRPGSGASALLKILYGDKVPLTSGDVEWVGFPKEEVARRAVGYVPADRMRDGVIAALTVGDNLALRRRTFFCASLWGAKKRSDKREFLDSKISEYMINPPDSEVLLGALSGGNVQKVLLAREVDYAEKLLLVESPTAGLDLSAAAFIRSMLRRKAEAGACVVVHSHDLDELVNLADRVVVFAKGRLVEELCGPDITGEAIGLALADVKPAQGSGARRLRKGAAAAWAD